MIRKSVVRGPGARRSLGRAILVAGLMLLTVPGAAGAAAYGDVIINEINWAGDEAGASREWVELFNPAAGPVSLSGWGLYETNTGATPDSAVKSVVLPAVVLPAGGYFLILGNDGDAGLVLPPETLSHAIPNFSGGLRNAGEQLVLKDEAENTIDLANIPGTAWFAGSNLPVKRSMARNDDFFTSAPDGTLPGSWHTSAVETGTGTPGLANLPTPSVPVPAAVWLFGPGLLGLVGVRRRSVKRGS